MFSILVLTALVCVPAIAQDSRAIVVDKVSAGAKVLVAPFENLTSVRAPVSDGVAVPRSRLEKSSRGSVLDRCREIPRVLVEDALVGVPGVTVLEHDPLESFLSKDVGLRESWSVDVASAKQIGKLVGASTVVLGTLLSLTSEDQSFRAYNIEVTKVVVRCSMRLRVVDVFSGQLLYSKILKGESTVAKGDFKGFEGGDLIHQLAEIAVESCRGDSALYDAIASGVRRTSPAVSVSFESSTRPCDVAIDGIYVGTTPLAKQLVVGKALRVSFSCDGNVLWNQLVVPVDGLIVAPALSPSLVKGGAPESRRSR